MHIRIGKLNHTECTVLCKSGRAERLYFSFFLSSHTRTYYESLENGASDFGTCSLYNSHNLPIFPDVFRMLSRGNDSGIDPCFEDSGS